MFTLTITACKDKKTDGRADEKNVINKTEVPTIVRDSFTSRYPAAAEVIWETAHEGNDDTYKVKFKNNGQYWKAEFQGNGTMIKEKQDE